MKTVRLSAFTAALCCAAVASGDQILDQEEILLEMAAQAEDVAAEFVLAEEVFLRKRMSPFPGASRPVVLRKPVRRTKPVWKIPQGKCGLEIKDGLRMIGWPAKDWSATLKTGFGSVTIPLAQITKLEPVGDGRFAAHLKNGDRVTGELISKTLPFETDFGTLSVPASDLVRLSTASPVKPTLPKSTGTRRTSKQTAPPKVILDGTQSVLPVFRK